MLFYLYFENKKGFIVKKKKNKSSLHSFEIFE